MVPLYAILDYTHPDALEFIKASRSDLSWVKRCLNVDGVLPYQTLLLS
jgi:hypothetical protein